MNATAEAIDDLLAELAARNVRIEASDAGELTYSAPPGAFTPDLRHRLVELKRDVLARLNGFRGAAFDEADIVEPDELTPCPTCGSLDAWHSCAGDRFGRTAGRWRCSACDPPDASRRMLAAAERIRADDARRRGNGRSGKGAENLGRSRP